MVCHYYEHTHLLQAFDSTWCVLSVPSQHSEGSLGFLHYWEYSNISSSPPSPYFYRHNQSLLRVCVYVCRCVRVRGRGSGIGMHYCHTHHFSPIVCNHRTQLSIALAPKLSTVILNHHVLPNVYMCIYTVLSFSVMRTPSLHVRIEGTGDSLQFRVSRMCSSYIIPKRLICRAQLPRGL